MKFLFDWIRSWFVISKASRHTMALQRECEKMLRQLKRSEELLEKQSQAAASAYSVVQNALATAQQQCGQYEETFQKFQAESKVHDLEMELMTAAYTKMIEHMKADTAIHVFRRTAANVRKGPFEED